MAINDESKYILNTLQEYFGPQEQFDLVDYLHCFGKGSGALLYSTLFLPQLIEIETSVFLTENIIDIEEVKKSLRGKTSTEIQMIEQSYNYIEVGYLFNAERSDLSDDEDELLARCIKNSWMGWLKINYPERSFNVHLITPEEMGGTVGVGFYENRI